MVDWMVTIGATAAIDVACVLCYAIAWDNERRRYEAECEERRAASDAEARS